MKTNIWDAKRSKWKSGIDKGLDISLKGEENILYLGASSGTTVSFLSEKTKGVIFAVEKAVMMAIDLIKLAEERKNIAPIFGDAHNVEMIRERVDKKIDILFQDIPSLDQVGILRKVSGIVDGDCKILLSLKLRSISQDVGKALDESREKLEEDFEILEEVSLEPFHRDHVLFVLRKR